MTAFDTTGRDGDGALELDADVPYAERVGNVLAFLGTGFAAGHPYAGIAATPVIDRSPEPWILGSTGSGAAIAAAYGIPFAYAHFIKGDGPQIIDAYRAAYRPSPRFPKPRVLVTVAAFCSPDPNERADFLATLTLRRARMRLERDPLPPTREEARTHVPSEAERPHVEETTRIALVTGPGDVRTRIEDVAGRHGAEEVLIVSVTPDYESRRRSYEAIAEAFCYNT